MGWSAIYQQADPRLESAISATQAIADPSTVSGTLNLAGLVYGVGGTLDGQPLSVSGGTLAPITVTFAAPANAAAVVQQWTSHAPIAIAASLGSLGQIVFQAPTSYVVPAGTTAYQDTFQFSAGVAQAALGLPLTLASPAPTIGGNQPDNSSELEMRNILAQLQNVDTQIQALLSTLMMVGTAGKVTLDAARSVVALKQSARHYVTRLARFLDAQPLADVFSSTPPDPMGANRLQAPVLYRG